MAAPTNTIWGNASTGSNGYQGKIGVYVTTTSTDTTTTVSVDVYYWSQYSVGDSSNTFTCTIGSDTKTWTSQSINTTSNSSFSESNQVKIGSHSYTFNRDTSASSKTIKAEFSGLDYGGGSGSVSTTASVPALPTYTVTYNANGGSGVPDAQTKIHGTTLTLSSTKPTRTGYTFSKWNTKSDGSGTSYNAGGSYTSNSSVTLYAIWTTNTYYIKYNANGGSGTMSNSTHTYGVAYNLTANAFTRTGYTFSGWSKTSTGTVAYSDKASFNNMTSTNGETINLYAVWSPYKHTVAYNVNGGSSTAPSNQTKTYGGTINITSTKPTRKGYTFVNWNTESNGTGTTYTSGQTYGYDQNGGTVTLYAQWSENYLTVNYYSNYATSYNGNSTPENTVNNNNVLVYTVKYYYDNEYASGLLDYNSGSTIGMVKTGYSSTGNWGTSTSGGTLIHQTTAFESGQALAEAFGKTLESGNVSVNVYAQWEENYLTVNYYSNYATSFSGKVTSENEVNNNNVIIWSQKYYYDDEYSSGLINYKDSGTNLHMTRTGYFATGYWGTSANGGILIEENAGFSSGQELAESFNLSLETGNKSVNIYAQWKHANVVYCKINGKYVLCNMYVKLNGKWKPCLCYIKIDDEWNLSVN